MIPGHRGARAGPCTMKQVQHTHDIQYLASLTLPIVLSSHMKVVISSVSPRFPNLAMHTFTWKTWHMTNQMTIRNMVRFLFYQQSVWFHKRKENYLKYKDINNMIQQWHSCCRQWYQLLLKQLLLSMHLKLISGKLIGQWAVILYATEL